MFVMKGVLVWCAMTTPAACNDLGMHRPAMACPRSSLVEHRMTVMPTHKSVHMCSRLARAHTIWVWIRPQMPHWSAPLPPPQRKEPRPYVTDIPVVALLGLTACLAIFLGPLSVHDAIRCTCTDIGTETCPWF